MPQPILVGNHLYFAREGETIDSVLVSRTAKPDTDPVANWTDIGIVSSTNIENQKTEIEIWKPSPGRLTLYDVLMSRQDLRLRCTIEECGPLLWEMLFGAVGSISMGSPNNGNYQPLTKKGFIKGWWKFQQYDQNDQLINVVDLYARADVTGQVEFGDQTRVVSYELDIRALYSPLNSGDLSNMI